MTLLETWRKWADVNAEGHPPYVLDADKESEAFRKLEARGRIGAYGNKREAYHDPNLKPNRLNWVYYHTHSLVTWRTPQSSCSWPIPTPRHSVAYGGGWDKNRHIANLEQDFSGMELPIESLSRHPNPERLLVSQAKANHRADNEKEKPLT